MEVMINPDEVLAFFKAMVSVERIRIAGLLAQEHRPLSPPEIGIRLNLAPVQVMRHLEQLQAAGIARSEAAGFRMDEKNIEDLARRHLAGRQARAVVEGFDGDASDQKVLADFLLEDGRLKSIPAQEKKLRVVLRYLAGKFQPDERYPEKQVNEILKQTHADSASLRRFLVDFGWMARENNLYWRLPDPEQPSD